MVNSWTPEDVVALLGERGTGIGEVDTECPSTRSASVVRSSPLVHSGRRSPAAWTPHLTSTSLLNRTPWQGSMKVAKDPAAVALSFIDGVADVPGGGHGFSWE